MKKFFVFVLVAIILAVGYGVHTGYIRLTNVSGGYTPVAVSKAKASAAESVKQESALRGAERLDEEIWSGIRRGDNETAKALLMDMGYDEEGALSFISEHANPAAAMNKRYVHILAEADDICVAEAVHYLVTVSGSHKDESDSGYWLYMRRENGKWKPGTFSEEETAPLDEQYAKLFPSAWVDAANAGRNATLFGNKMWTKRDGVIDGFFQTNVVYMHQEENGETVIGVVLANGENIIRNMKSLTVTIKDDKLGQVLKHKEKCSASVLPGTAEIYELRVPASKVKKGTWTTMHADVHSDY